MPPPWAQPHRRDLEGVLQLHSLPLLTPLSVAQRLPRREIADFKKEQCLKDKGKTYQPALHPRKRGSRKDADPKTLRREEQTHTLTTSKMLSGHEPLATGASSSAPTTASPPAHLAGGRPQAMLFFKPPPSAQAGPSPAKEESCSVCVL